LMSESVNQPTAYWPVVWMSIMFMVA
jgi:hypothetical protein